MIIIMFKLIQVGMQNLTLKKTCAGRRGPSGKAAILVNGSTSLVATASAAAFPQDILVANPASPKPQTCSQEISLPINLSIQPLAHAQNLQAGHLSMLATKWMNSSQLKRWFHSEDNRSNGENAHL